MALPLEVWTRVRRELLSAAKTDSLEALRTLIALYGAVKELRETHNNDDDWSTALSALGIGHSAQTPLVMPDYKAEQAHEADKRPAGPPSTAVAVMIARHGRCSFCDHFQTSKAKAKDVVDVKALAKDRITLKLAPAFERINFSLWSPAERMQYRLDRKVPQDVRRAVRAKYAQPKVEGEDKPRRVTDTSMTDHDALVHSFATSPPVSSLSISIAGKKMTANNKAGVTVFDVLLAISYYAAKEKPGAFDSVEGFWAGFKPFQSGKNELRAHPIRKDNDERFPDLFPEPPSSDDE